MLPTFREASALKTVACLKSAISHLLYWSFLADYLFFLCIACHSVARRTTVITPAITRTPSLMTVWYVDLALNTPLHWTCADWDVYKRQIYNIVLQLNIYFAYLYSTRNILQNFHLTFWRIYNHTNLSKFMFNQILKFLPKLWTLHCYSGILEYQHQLDKGKDIHQWNNYLQSKRNLFIEHKQKLISILICTINYNIVS